MDLTIKDRGSYLQDYNAQIQWLHSLITDKTGAHYLQEKDPETKLRDFQEILRRLASFLDFAGNPQTKFKSIHVAGTSGKGSVVSTIASILKGCGFRTGHHVSPFLQVSTEKLMLDGKRIPLDQFNELVHQFRLTYESWQSASTEPRSLKYTEAWMALNFLWFARSNVDWAVIETGMGGRYDPSNLLPSKLAVITNVDFDHVHELGPTLRDIAAHKAGIIKRDQPAITAAQHPDVLDVLEQEAQKQNARLYQWKRDFDFQIHQMDETGLVLSVDAPYHSYPRLRTSLTGTFQAENVALSLASVDVLAEAYGFSISPESLESSLQNVNIHGRMEVIQQHPLVILDGAHNPHKMQALVESIQALHPNRPITAILGILMNKDAGQIFESLLPAIKRVIATKYDILGKPSLEPEQLAAKIHEIDPAKEIIIAHSVREAIETAMSIVKPDELILITGSLYMLGEARNTWVSPESLLFDE